MSSRRRNGTNPNGGRPRFDRSAAFAYYVALGPQRTKRAVAAEFQVSEQTIGKWSRLEDWDEKAEAIDAKAAAGASAKAERSLEERRSRVISVAEKLVDRVLDAELAELDLSAALRAIPRYAHFQELIAGEATDRISLTDVQALQDAYHEFIRELGVAFEKGEKPSPDEIVERLREHMTATFARSAA